MLKELMNPERVVGTYRTFGSTGAVYEVVGVAREVEGDVLMRVKTVIGEEEIELPLSQVITDPET